MMAVLDTVALQHLLRKPKKDRRRSGPKSRIRTALDPVLEDRRLRLGMDATNALLNEWQTTCGEDVNVVVTTWGEWGALVYFQDPPKLGHCTTRKLRQLRFRDSVDKLIIRLSLGLTTKYIVTEDPDFWDPTDNDSKGCPSAPVASHCRQEHGIRIWLLGEFLRHVGCAQEKKSRR